MRYLWKTLAVDVAYALLGLLALYSFFSFIKEFQHLNRGEYHRFVDAVIDLALQMPDFLYEFMPVGVLIGSMCALASLAGHSELTVMRASRLSMARLLAWLAGFGLCCGVVIALLGEWIVPVSLQLAKQRRDAANPPTATLSSGLWAKDGQQIINITQLLPDFSVWGVRIYRFSAGQRLSEIIDADHGHYRGPSSWVLNTVRRTQFLEKNAGVTVQLFSQWRWHSNITLDTLAVLLVPPSHMSARSLIRYIRHLELNKQKTESYRLTLWGKLIYPFVCWVMVIVALPFSHTQRRGGKVGVRLLIGIILGASFHLLSRILFYLGEFHIGPPFLLVSFPALLLLSVAMALLYRQERRH